MAGAIQWTVTEFWKQLQNVEGQIKRADAALQADKATLTALYSQARKQYEPAGSHDRAYLEPLIHQNSVLRLQYLAPVKAKFNEAVRAASAALRGAGYNTPNLGGLGVAPALIVVPAVAVAALGVAIAAVAVVNRLTSVQVNRTATARAIFSDSSTSFDQKMQLADKFKTELEAEKRAEPPPVFDTGWIVPAAALIALIVLGPQLMRTLGGRRAAA
jgi:hypothetical protein